MPRLYEHQGKRLLAEAGIDIPEGRVITRREEIPEALSEIGLPVHPSVSSCHLFFQRWDQCGGQTPSRKLFKPLSGRVAL